MPAGEITDWPDFATRGYLLDVSRNRVPTRETLSRLVDLLDLLRINHLQLSTEHAFAYTDHETVWSQASPMTAADVEWLDALCHSRGIELAANQATFGHMERWLRHERYAHQAHAPDRRQDRARPAALLAPSESNAAFAVALCRELLSHHRGGRINIGCDEPLELGDDANAAAMYAEHVHRIIGGLRGDATEILMWGDMLWAHPEIAPTFRDAATVLLWHYDAPTEGSVGFASQLEALVGSGVKLWVCPGTSAWNSLIGRIDNARSNLVDASIAGAEADVEGYLITDWGDGGHLNPPSVSWPALVYGAGLAWCADVNRDADVAGPLDSLVFADETEVLGALVDRMGRVHGHTGQVAANGSPLFFALVGGSPADVTGDVDQRGVSDVIEALDDAIVQLEDARPGAVDGARCWPSWMRRFRLARHGAYRMSTGRTNATLEADLRDAIERQARPGSRGRAQAVSTTVWRRCSLRRVATVAADPARLPRSWRRSGLVTARAPT